ncbi:MAG TPA: acetamidase/formamidase family protein [Pseudolabrys sp.]|nr:acetamidase/formamidase family protein [Pseudolabrys sp.]
MPQHHTLKAKPGTVHWGYYDAAHPATITIASGDTVSIESISGHPEMLPPKGSPFTILPEHAGILAATTRGPGPHLLTGPVAVAGAEPGDALKIEILEVKLRQDWGYQMIRPLAGTLPEDFHETTLTHVGLDIERGIARMAWGLEFPTAPFFGCMGVAPPAAWGRQTSVIPRVFGGNIDCKDLVAGTTLHLPVFTPGGLFSVGDGHGAQGHGEVCLTAIETSLSGTFRISIEKNAKLDGPWAETPTHIITLAFNEDLDDAAKNALRAMIKHIVASTKLTREEAYALCSLTADLHVTQLVNVHKGIHVMLPRWALG